MIEASPFLIYIAHIVYLSYAKRREGFDYVIEPTKLHPD